MTGEKKIVGLWRGQAGTETSDASPGPSAVTPSEATASAADEVSPRDWLDMSPLIEAEIEALNGQAASPDGRGRFVSILLIILGLGWTAFALAAATDGFANLPTFEQWPVLIATIAMPLTLLIVLWMLILRSSRSEQARFERIATSLRAENDLLAQSMQNLGQSLSDAQRKLSEQAAVVQQFGQDAATRMADSSDRLAANASVIANANEQLASSGDVALQRMDGLLAGLPRIDDVAQRLAGNFREAGLVAHQQGASLEAQLAALAEEAARARESSAASTTELLGALESIEAKGDATGARLRETAQEVGEIQTTALAHLTSLADAARNEMGLATDALVLKNEQFLDQFRRGIDAASTQLSERLATARDNSDEIGQAIARHGQNSESLAEQIARDAASVRDHFSTIDATVAASSETIGNVVAHAREQLVTFQDDVTKGSVGTTELIGHTESLLLALDAVTRELDETLPLAMARMTAHGEATEAAIAKLRPALDASELVAQSALSHVNAAHAALTANETQISNQAARQRELADGVVGAIAKADTALRLLRDDANIFAKEGGADMLAMLGDVRKMADETTVQARDTLDQLVSGAREAMQATATEAISAAFRTEILAQLDAINEASERAVAAAGNATDRLMRQLITIMDTSANVEARVAEAEQAIAISDRESLTKQVGLLTESLKSTSIDLTKILSTEVSDTAWDAYLKGDRGVFARRAVKLVENSDAKEILRLYQHDDAFHAGVNQFVHDFEAILRLLMSARDGSAISVTLLSSDIGKLYVGLAQAIDRLRN